MKKNAVYLAILTAFCCISSCSDDKEDHLNQWMMVNVNAFNAIKSNPEYKEIISPGNEGSIYYKVLQSGNGIDSIKYTSTVTCYYKGWLIADYPHYKFKAGHVFDQKLFDDGPPAQFTVSGLTGGWKTALQHMTKGEKWEIWVPYQLGYGREGSVDLYTGEIKIPGYSTLVFEMEVLKVKGIDD